MVLLGCLSLLLLLMICSILLLLEPTDFPHSNSNCGFISVNQALSGTFGQGREIGAVRSVIPVIVANVHRNLCG